MTVVSRLARPMMAGIFISGGIDTFRKPEGKAKAGEPVVATVHAAVPAVPDDPVLLARVNAATQVGAAALMAVGVMPRLCAGILAASLVPTTLAGHRFWEHEDPTRRAMQRTHLLKNAAILGGLLETALQPRHGGRRRRGLPASGTD